MTSLEQELVERDSRLREVLDWLKSLDHINRARYLSVLLDRQNASLLSRMRVEAVYEATREASHAEVAAGVGVSGHAVNHAVTQHMKNMRQDRVAPAAG
jgi:hypothetical protein